MSLRVIKPAIDYEFQCHAYCKSAFTSNKNTRSQYKGNMKRMMIMMISKPVCLRADPRRETCSALFLSYVFSHRRHGMSNSTVKFCLKQRSTVQL